MGFVFGLDIRRTTAKYSFTATRTTGGAKIDRL